MADELDLQVMERLQKKLVPSYDLQLCAAWIRLLILRKSQRKDNELPCELRSSYLFKCEDHFDINDIKGKLHDFQIIAKLYVYSRQSIVSFLFESVVHQNATRCTVSLSY